MKRVLLHIGYHKTATSWMQSKLFESTNNVFEPLSISPYGQSSLARKFLFNRGDHLISPFDLNTSELQKELKTILDKKPNVYNKIPVVSHENLSGNVCGGGLEALSTARRLKAFFPDARVLIVIREQKSFLLSYYFQYLKMRGLKSIGRFLRARYDDLKVPLFSPDHLKYVELIKYYYELFGSEKVLVMPYELFRENPQQFMEEFSGFIHETIELDEEKYSHYVNKKQHHFVNYYFRILTFLRKRGNPMHIPYLNNWLIDFITRMIQNLLFFLVPKKMDRWIINRVKKNIALWENGRYKETNKQLGKLIDRDLSKWRYY